MTQSPNEITESIILGFLNLIYDILSFYIIFQNSDILVISRFQWLISGEG
jgi:hypothetical protein